MTDNQAQANPSLLVTGAGGFLGRAVLAVAGPMARGLSRGQLDIAEEEEVARCLDSLQPEVVINCAAWADVDRCEREPEGAFRANALGPALLADACARRNIHLVHVSTDYVFSGHPQRSFGPLDLRGPVNTYGLSKARGEEQVLEAFPGAVIARVAWLYGRGGRGFGCGLPLKLAKGEPVRALSDRLGHPTYVRDAAARLVVLARAHPPGIYHVVNSGTTSWYAFACRMADRLAVPGLVRPVSRLELPPAAPRPVRLALAATFSGTGEWAALRSWEDAQDAYLRELIVASGGVP